MFCDIVKRKELCYYKNIEIEKLHLYTIIQHNTCGQHSVLKTFKIKTVSQLWEASLHVGPNLTLNQPGTELGQEALATSQPAASRGMNASAWRASALLDPDGGRLPAARPPRSP